MKHFIRVSVLIIFILSCKSTQSGFPGFYEPPRLNSRRIDTMLESNRPFAAYKLLIEDERREYFEVDYDRNDEKEKIFEYIRNQFIKAESEKNYPVSSSIINSLDKLGKKEILNSDTDLNRIRLDFIENQYLNKNYFVALKYFINQLENGATSDEDLIKYADLAVAVNNNFYLRRIMREMEERDIPVSLEYIEAAEKTDNPSDMIKGTVTIWVNRGIRVEGGVGRPDRVIGSGFFIDPRGYLLTNYHVIESEVNPEYEGYSRLYIRLSDSIGTRVPAKVIGWDPIFDIALLKTEIIPEYIFSMSETRDFQIGDKIFAIGSPGGLENTLTSGIISSRSRKFLQIGDAIQVDVPINPGNSGGPLLNSRGELIGVVFAGIEQFEGINFAIPSHWIADIIPDLYSGGEVTHGWVGSVLYERTGSLEILYNVPGEAADRSGLKKGDVIKSINGKTVKTVLEAQKILMPLRNDTVIDIVYERDNIENSTLLVLGSRTQKSFEAAIKRDSMKNLALPLFGMEIEPTGSYLFKDSYIVKRVYDGSIADEIGLSVNDPFDLKAWRYDLKKRFALMRIEVKKRKAGFMETNLQLITSIDSNNLI